MLRSKPLIYSFALKMVLNFDVEELGNFLRNLVGRFVATKGQYGVHPKR